MTTEQTVMLAALERSHGKIKRIADESDLGETLLTQCISDTRAYSCERCRTVFTIEPDGECEIWAFVPDPS